ncbi:MAG: cyclodeaminase/cyclohydrolase family protein [Candidatus Omnitrophica bacterium]|nr:cyclodeaminase/cyclohydrolase family protein [Candidatus Omnitrophota bacterium]
MADYKTQSLQKYLDDLAAKISAPGGGSAAALTASMAAGLVSMVVNFTLGKPRYSRYEGRLRKILEESERLRQEFINLIDLDVVAYKSGNLRNALDVPLTVCRLCYAGAGLCLPLVKIGNINLISDVAVAVILFESAFESAYFNVEINLKLLNDEKIRHTLRRELKKKGMALMKRRLDIEERVGKIIRG